MGELTGDVGHRSTLPGTSERLCQSCRLITLDKLLETTQLHSYPRPPGGGCGIPTSHPHVIIRNASLSFKSSAGDCQLCDFISSQVSGQQSAEFNMPTPLEMALSLPPITRYHFFYQDTMKYEFLRRENEFHGEFPSDIGKAPTTVQSISTLEQFSGHPVKINVASRAG